MTLQDELIQYSHDCMDGVIPANIKHKWACMRFLHDVERAGTEEFPYIFNEPGALDFIEWMRLFKHRKGILRGQHIEPAPIQRFIFGNIYGWIHKDTGYRRFDKMYWQVAKKNAKSQSLACVGTYEEMAFGEGAAEVYCAATKTEQAKIVYDEAAAMLRGCRELEGKFGISYGRIWHKKTGSFMRALSKEDQKTGDGLNPQCIIIDEYQAHETTEVYDITESGTVARAQPLTASITTAGFDLSKPCYSIEYKLCTKILDPNNPFTAENYFVMINELDEGDDIKDEKNWIKANPILCSYPEGINSLRKKLNLALEAPEKMRDFLTKHMDIWVQMKEQGYMPMDKWAACAASKDNPFPDIKGLEVITGLDLSTRNDLTSLSPEIRLKDGRIGVMSHSFMPQETMDNYRKRNNTNFPLWEKQGYITVTPGAVVDYSYILDYLEKIYADNEWKKGEIAFDRALATWLSQELEKRGFMPVEIAQGMLTLGAPTKDFRTEVYKPNVIHEGNPVLTWAMGNAICDEDKNENIILNKTKSKEKIDPAAALMNAHVRYVVKPKVSPYMEHGLRTFD